MNNFIKTIIESASNIGIPTILIVGLALPAYNVARTTLDIDISIHVDSQEQLDIFIINLEKKEIYTKKKKPKITHDLFTVFEKKNEAEIWLKPCDSFDWDEDMLTKKRLFQKNIDVLAVEDFIITKLGRTDRSSIDINDVLQILIANKDNLDWKYLKYRLNWAGLTDDFIEIIDAFSLDIDSRYRSIAKSLIDKFKKSNEY